MKKNLLIVDDESSIRDSLARRYKLKGYSIETAGNGIEALKKMEKISFQVVISDIVMPEMDGVDLLRKIQSEYPMTKVIMITGYVTLENALACLRRGAFNLIFKPLTELNELDESVEDAIEFLHKWEEKLSKLIGMKE